VRSTGKRPTGHRHLHAVLADVTIRIENNVVPSRASGLIIYRLHI